MATKIRLLKWADDGSYNFECFARGQVPPYAILSHTWSTAPDEEEVLYHDVVSGHGHQKAGIRKIQFCIRQARRDGLSYFWVDSCCIDKTNSAELQAAIGFMFSWYQAAAKCYVYLSDVVVFAEDPTIDRLTWQAAFRGSRWFTRGWTLQELLAPSVLEFFSKDEVHLGDKLSMKDEISAVTGIPTSAVEGKSLEAFTVTERLSWVAQRSTTEEEDIVYCMIGICDVSMPIIYSEGRKKAERRLLAAIEGAQNENHQKVERHREVLSWLSPLDFTSQQHDIISRRQTDTGVWFEESMEFTNWVEGTCQTLMCPGIPGAGKTMIAAIAADYLCRRSYNNDTISVAWVFCNFKAQGTQTASALMAALTAQLLRHRSDLTSLVAALHEKHGKVSSHPRLEEIRDLFISISSSSTYVIVDALDECNVQERTCNQLVEALKLTQAATGVKLMFTSRFIPEIIERVDADVVQEIRASTHDIRQYVAGQMYRLPSCLQRNPVLQDTTCAKIVEAVDGMFLLARLYVDALQDKKTPRKIITTLDGFGKGSEGLENAYDDALKRIQSQLPGDVQLAKHTLSWIVHGCRPLNVVELTQALAVEPGDRALDEENIPEIADVLAVCGGLVIVDENSNVVRLVHFTTQTYLSNSKWLDGAQQYLATVCLTFLSFDVFKTCICRNVEDVAARLAQHQFLEYASNHWGIHVKPVESEVLDLALVLLRDDTLVQSLQQTTILTMNGMLTFGEYWIWKRSDFVGKPSTSTSLHLVAKHGLAMLTRHLLTADSLVDQLDKSCFSPLMYAAQRGSVDIVRSLLDFAADVNLTDRDQRSALWLATKGKHHQVVQLLLDCKDINVNDQTGHDERAALHVAVDNGDETSLRLLLEHDRINVNVVDGHYQSPLYRAARQGYHTLVQLLLARADIEMNPTSGFMHSPLCAAIIGDHESVARLFLQHKNFDVHDRRSYNGQSPLAVAVKYRNDRMIRMLLQHYRTDVNAQDRKGDSPLLLASRSGLDSTVILLIECERVDVNSRNDKGNSPLHVAVENRHESTVRLLLTCENIEVNAENKEFWTPLALAAENGCVAILWPNPVDPRDENGHEQVVELLLKNRDTRTDCVSGYPCLPLDVARQRGDKAIIGLLMAHSQGEVQFVEETVQTDVTIDY